MEQPHQPCPYPSCASSDAFSFESEKGVGKCHSCGRGYPSREPTFEWAKEKYPTKEKETKMTKRPEITGTTYEGIRGLDADVAKLYGIQGQTDENGDIVQYAFKYPTNVKYRDTAPAGGDKKIWMKERGSPINDLFGPKVNAGSSKRIYITEGEFDAASLFQALGKTYPVMSLPSASWGEKFLQRNKDYLDSFSEVVYAGELDEAGSKSATRLYNTFPSKFYSISLTKHKDANDFLVAGDEAELKWSALKPQRYTPENFYVSLDKFEKIILDETPYEYTPTACEGLNDVINGHTKGGMTLYKAFPGTGKTALFRYFQYDLLKNTDQKIAVLHLEESKSSTLRGLSSYELGVNVSTKEAAEDNGISEEEVTQSLSKFLKNENLILFEFKKRDYEDIFEATLDYLRTAITVYGADYIFLDHIQRLAYMAGVEQATNNLTTFAVKAEDMCRDLNVGFNAISHVNSEGAAKYAKALEEACIISIDLNRDKESEDEIIQNTVQLSIPGKNRPWARLGNAGALYYDRETTLLRESTFVV